jgi:flavin reductase (DIM6/NTAB) family NADH-FMN oxidoreductase RutF
MGTHPEPDDRKATAAAVGRIPSGLFVLTARRGADETGMLGSWVQQCSFDPLLVSVCVRSDRDLLAWLTPGADFIVNVLDDTQTDMVAHFGRGFDPGQPAFEGLEVFRPGEGAPVLADSLAFLACRVVSRHPTGDHELLVAEVRAGRVLSAEGRPMVHVRKSGLHY